MPQPLPLGFHHLFSVILTSPSSASAPLQASPLFLPKFSLLSSRALSKSLHVTQVPSEHCLPSCVVKGIQDYVLSTVITEASQEASPRLPRAGWWGAEGCWDPPWGLATPAGPALTPLRTLDSRSPSVSWPETWLAETRDLPGSSGGHQPDGMWHEPYVPGQGQNPLGCLVPSPSALSPHPRPPGSLLKVASPPHPTWQLLARQRACQPWLPLEKGCCFKLLIWGCNANCRPVEGSQGPSDGVSW